MQILPPLNFFITCMYCVQSVCCGGEDQRTMCRSQLYLLATWNLGLEVLLSGLIEVTLPTEPTRWASLGTFTKCGLLAQ